MYESFIKEWLLEGQSKVYSVIIKTYRQRLEDLKPALFRKWLAKEIDVPEDKINLSSLNSALLRQRKKEIKGKKDFPTTTGDVDSIINNQDSFQFSSIEKNTPKSRTTELLLSSSWLFWWQGIFIQEISKFFLGTV